MRALIITNSITRRDQKSIEKYLTEIARYEVLSPDEETRLFQKIEQGDQRALEKIVNHNLRFVVSVSKQYQHLGFALGDLVNEGNLGLIKAAHRFDPSKGFKFISYAVWWIRQSILQAINDKSRKIRLPQNLRGDTSKVITTMVKFLQVEEREPSMDELEEITGMKASKIKKCLESYKMCSSLDAPVMEESETSLADLMEDSSIPQPDFQLSVRESQQAEIRQMLRSLNAQQAKIISMYYGIGNQDPMSLEDIGQVFGISRERVRQIKDKGLKILRRKAG